MSLKLKNKTQNPLTVRGNEIGAGLDFQIPNESMLDFAKDPYLRVRIFSGDISILVDDIELNIELGTDWIHKIAIGSILYEVEA